MNTNYVQGQTIQMGEIKTSVLYGYGPNSYAGNAGDPIYNPGSYDNIVFPMECLTQSGNYELLPVPTTCGTLRAGASSSPGLPFTPGWRWLWVYSGRQGVLTLTQNAAGSGMTPGNVGTVTFTGGGGAGATGTFTVLTATTGTFAITNNGSGYTSTPTGTVTGTGGTPPTTTVTVAPSAGSVPATTNLSAEVAQFGCLVSQL